MGLVIFLHLYTGTVYTYSFHSAEGISHNPCDYQLYCGDFAGSELENIAITEEILRISSSQTLLAFVDVHTFGQMILMPLR